MLCPCKIYEIINLNTFLLQLFGDDLKLTYVNITIEPYGELSANEGVPTWEQFTSKHCYLSI